jgi:hypothetical protein
MDFPRSYLDENVWTNRASSGLIMADFPLSNDGKPIVNSLIIDFTHQIDRTLRSPNQERWMARLKTIESRWGAEGDDSMWCAPTAEVADYVHAAKTASFDVAPGRLTVHFSEDVPGTSLTLRLIGLSEKSKPGVPKEGGMYWRGNELFLTTPKITTTSHSHGEPHVRCVYDGPAISMMLSNEMSIAGVVLRLAGNAVQPVDCEVAVRSTQGEKTIGRKTIPAGWHFGSELFPIVPAQSPVIGNGIVVRAAEPVKTMTVWVVDEKKEKP